MALTNKSWFQNWLILYAFGLILIPPVHIGEKTVFAAEWLLVPVFCILTLRFCSAKIQRPPWQLIFLVVALVVTYFAGLLRGNLAVDYNMYLRFTEDQFSWTQDTIRLIRWIVIFSTPWILAQFAKVDGREIFLKYLKIFVLISAFLAFAERWGGLNLAKIYGPLNRGQPPWTGRSYATFQTPLEASLVFAAFSVQSLMSLSKLKGKKLAVEIFCAVIFVTEFLLTRSLTGFAAALITLIYIGSTNLRRSRRILATAAVLTLVLVILYLTPKDILSLKLHDFSVRMQTWWKWAASLPKHPHLLFIGLGFSYLVIDSSFMFILMDGGLILAIASYLWLKELLQKVPVQVAPFILVWIISWLTLDSIGYWGIGRINWALLGLFSFQLDRRAASFHR